MEKAWFEAPLEESIDLGAKAVCLWLIVGIMSSDSIHNPKQIPDEDDIREDYVIDFHGPSHWLRITLTMHSVKLQAGSNPNKAFERFSITFLNDANEPLEEFLSIGRHTQIGKVTISFLELGKLRRRARRLIIDDVEYGLSSLSLTESLDAPTKEPLDTQPTKHLVPI